MRLVDRIAYINHDIDDALRAGVLAPDDLPARGDRGARADRARARIDTLVHDLVEHSEAAGDIVQGEEVGARDAAPARVHVRARLPRADARAPSTRRSSACCAACSTGTASTRRSCRRAATGADAGRPRDRLPGGHDRPLRHPRLDRALRAAGLRALDGALHRRLAASASATRSTSSSSSARGRSCEAPGQRRLQGLCPFHDERTPSFGIDPVEKLYHCFGCGAGGDVFTFVMETEGLDFGGRWSRWPSATASSSSARARTRATPRSASGASGCSRCWSAPPPTTCACCGSRGEAARGARVPRSAAGSTRATLREFRVGYAPSRVGPRAARRRGARASPSEELLAAGLAQRGARRRRR